VKELAKDRKEAMTEIQDL